MTRDSDVSKKRGKSFKMRPDREIESFEQRGGITLPRVRFIEGQEPPMTVGRPAMARALQEAQDAADGLPDAARRAQYGSPETRKAKP